MHLRFVLTCEHAGNFVPAEYAHLFAGEEEVLYTHSAIDFGALRLAKHLAAKSNLELHYTIVSRLLVEANRSPDSEDLFSDFSQDLPDKDKKAIMEKYYYPHRNQVEEEIRHYISKGQEVVHLAIHTFTPAQEGKVREAEIGILFDPARFLEQDIADTLSKELLARNPERKVLFNTPYPGVADGFPTYLRKHFSADKYAGFEIEVNQKFFLDGEPEVWETIVEEFTDAFVAVKKSKEQL